MALNEQSLDELLSTPHAETIAMMQRLKGDIMILGVAGKMGMTLAAMAVKACRNAGVEKNIYGVARFSDPESVQKLEEHGVKTIKCDLLNREELKSLPAVPNIIYMAGRKFGTDGSEDLTWAMNAVCPAFVAETFAASNIVAFSTGCVYPLRSVREGGCTEAIAPAPVGEYSQSCLGRERVFQYYSRKNGTKILLYRLNYAIDMRYGVLHDIASKIINDEPVDASVGHFNIIWQGDANNYALRCLEHCSNPPALMNITGPETVSVKYAAEYMGAKMGKKVTYSAPEFGDRCYLNNADKALSLFGYPTISVRQMLDWQAEWLLHGGRSLGKPTHFEVNNGKF
ncbi:MAG: hypothetical protein PHQ27_01465 [Victivallales bacterium]|nr:hypothetical protein [Victivallales bacterium]